MGHKLKKYRADGKWFDVIDSLNITASYFPLVFSDQYLQ